MSTFGPFFKVWSQFSFIETHRHPSLSCPISLRIPRFYLKWVFFPLLPLAYRPPLLPFSFSVFYFVIPIIVLAVPLYRGPRVPVTHAWIVFDVPFHCRHSFLPSPTAFGFFLVPGNCSPALLRFLPASDNYSTLSTYPRLRSLPGMSTPYVSLTPFRRLPSLSTTMPVLLNF